MKLILCGFPIFGQRPQPGFAERFRRGYKYVHTQSVSKFENVCSSSIFSSSTLKAANGILETVPYIVDNKCDIYVQLVPLSISFFSYCIYNQGQSNLNTV